MAPMKERLRSSGPSRKNDSSTAEPSSSDTRKRNLRKVKMEDDDDVIEVEKKTMVRLVPAPDLFDGKEKPAVMTVPPKLPDYSLVLAVEDKLREMGLGKISKLPWCCDGQLVAEELAYFNKNLKKEQHSKFRYNYRYWTLDDFRRVFDLPAGGEDVSNMKRGKYELYKDYFDTEYKDKAGWKISSVKDEHLRTVMMFIKPFLHKAQTSRIFAKEAAAIIDSYNNEREMDWGPVLYNTMMRSVETAGKSESFYLPSFVVHMYEGMDCLMEEERTALETTKINFMLEDAPAHRESSDESGAEPSPNNSDGTPVITKVVTSHKRGATEEALMAAKKAKGSPFSPFPALTDADFNFEDDDFQNRKDGMVPSAKTRLNFGHDGPVPSLISLRDGLVAYCNSHLQSERLLSSVYKAAGVEDLEGLAAYISASQSSEKDLKQKVEDMEAVIRSQKAKQMANDLAISSDMGDSIAAVKETMGNLRSLYLWKDTFLSDVNLRLHSVGSDIPATANTVADKGAARILGNCWANVMGAVTSQVTKFQTTVERSTELLLRLEEFIAYFKAFQECLEAEKKVPSRATKGKTAQEDPVTMDTSVAMKYPASSSGTEKIIGVEDAGGETSGVERMAIILPSETVEAPVTVQQVAEHSPSGAEDIKTAEEGKQEDLPTSPLQDTAPAPAEPSTSEIARDIDVPLTAAEEEAVSEVVTAVTAAQDVVAEGPSQDPNTIEPSSPEVQKTRLSELAKNMFVIE